jgi:sugar phosphate isomerase/epimerase
MEFGLSTHLFVGERLSSHILDGILAAGFRTLEIFAARQHLDYHDPNHVRDVAQWFKDHEMTLHSLHAPLYADFDWGRSGGQALSVAYLERRRRIDSMEEIKRAIEVAERIPFRYLILHLGVAEEEYDLQKFDAAMTSIEHLKIFAKERGAQILLENTPNELSTPARLVEFLGYSRLQDLKICFETLKGRIASTHLHDNGRDKDEHAFPYDGGIDWEQTMRDFRSVEGQFPLIFELRDYGPEKSSLGRLREVMQKMDSIR